MALSEAVNEAAAVKATFFGFQGSGKSVTAALLAAGLSKRYHDGRPVAMYDTEPGSDFLIPIFKAEGIKFLTEKSRSFKGGIEAMHDAEKAGACVYIVDSVTHMWGELQEAYVRENNLKRDLQFQDWRWLKERWNDLWVIPMLASPMHIIVCGRAGNEYESQEKTDWQGNPTGKREMVQGDTKVQAEKQFGHEPSLLVEMIQRRVADEGTATVRGRDLATAANKKGASKKGDPAKKGVSGGHYVHEAHVLKDRTWALNGAVLTFEGEQAYKPGGYGNVLEAFMPHLANLAIGRTHHSLNSSSSAALVGGATGSQDYWRYKRFSSIQVETLDATLDKLWPGSAAASKAARATAGEALFSVRSKTALDALPLPQLIQGVKALLLFEEMIRDGRATMPPEEHLRAALQAAKLMIPYNECKEAASKMVDGEMSISDAATVDHTPTQVPTATIWTE